jgi:hypothetical protein
MSREITVEDRRDGEFYRARQVHAQDFAVRLRSSWRLIGQRLGQRDEEFLSGAPAGNGTLVDRLPHLHSTRGSHQPSRLAFKAVDSIAPAGRT